MAVQEIHSYSDFEDLISKYKYVLVDFSAQWCPPCKAIAPFYEGLAKKHSVESKLAFAKVDIEEVPEISKGYGVTSLPSFLLFTDGEVGGIEAGSISGGGAVITEGKVGLIRGADPKNLAMLAERLEKAAKEGA